jgi:hypothetical protein
MMALGKETDRQTHGLQAPSQYVCVTRCIWCLHDPPTTFFSRNKLSLAFNSQSSVAGCLMAAAGLAAYPSWVPTMAMLAAKARGRRALLSASSGSRRDPGPPIQGPLLVFTDYCEEAAVRGLQMVRAAAGGALGGQTPMECSATLGLMVGEGTATSDRQTTGLSAGEGTATSDSGRLGVSNNTKEAAGGGGGGGGGATDVSEGVRHKPGNAADVSHEGMPGPFAARATIQVNPFRRPVSSQGADNALPSYSNGFLVELG